MVINDKAPFKEEGKKHAQNDDMNTEAEVYEVWGTISRECNIYLVQNRCV